MPGSAALSRLAFVLAFLLTARCADAEGSNDARGSAKIQGKTLYEGRKFEAAANLLESALRADPQDRESAQLLGLCYYSLGRYRAAIPLLAQLESDLGATATDTSYLLGMCYLKSGQPDRARGAFARMYSLVENSAAARLVFARMLVREHMEDKAVPELESALSADPRLPMAHFLLGEIWLYKGDAERGVDEFNKELQVNPAVWLVHWRLGDALARLDQYAEAERALKQSIWLNESFSGPYVTLGQIALKRGDIASAIALLERAAQMDPNNQHAHYSLARAYQRAGRTDKADRQFEISRSLLGEKNASTLNAP